MLEKQNVIFTFQNLIRLALKLRVVIDINSFYPKAVKLYTVRF